MAHSRRSRRQGTTLLDIFNQALGAIGWTVFMFFLAAFFAGILLKDLQFNRVPESSQDIVILFCVLLSIAVSLLLNWWFKEFKAWLGSIYLQDIKDSLVKNWFYIGIVLCFLWVVPGWGHDYNLVITRVELNFLGLPNLIWSPIWLLFSGVTAWVMMFMGTYLMAEARSFWQVSVLPHLKTS